VFDQVARDQGAGVSSRRGEVAGAAVEEDAQACGVPGVEVLGQEGGEDAAEYVAGASGGHARVAGGVDGGPAVGVGDDGGGGLAEGDAAGLLCQAAGGREAVLEDGAGGEARQARELARVRRQHDGDAGREGAQALGASLGAVGGEEVEGVGVQDAGRVGVFEQEGQEGGGVGGGAEARAEQEDLGGQGFEERGGEGGRDMSSGCGAR
jgi:hypothetical protein